MDLLLAGGQVERVEISGFQGGEEQFAWRG